MHPTQTLAPWVSTASAEILLRWPRAPHTHTHTHTPSEERGGRKRRVAILLRRLLLLRLLRPANGGLCVCVCRASVYCSAEGAKRTRGTPTHWKRAPPSGRSRTVMASLGAQYTPRALTSASGASVFPLHYHSSTLPVHSSNSFFHTVFPTDS